MCSPIGDACSEATLAPSSKALFVARTVHAAASPRPRASGSAATHPMKPTSDPVPDVSHSEAHARLIVLMCDARPDAVQIEQKLRLKGLAEEIGRKADRRVGLVTDPPVRCCILDAADRSNVARKILQRGPTNHLRIALEDREHPGRQGSLLELGIAGPSENHKPALAFEEE